MEITGELLSRIRRGLFKDARIAAFDGDKRVTEWQPYDPDESVRICSGRTAVTHLRIEAPDGHVVNAGTGSMPATPGETVYLPAGAITVELTAP